jgi:type VI secretion system secreted protein VgrG
MAAADTFHIKTDSPAGPDLMFWRIAGHETLSRPSHYELTVLSERGDINASEILGRAFDVVIDFHDKANALHQRHCQGHAIRFARAGEAGRYFRYHIALQSWFGLLTRRINSRILQDKDPQAIFNDIVDDSPIKRIKQFKPVAFGAKKVHRYCTQFQESDYNFLSRLFEEEGVYYWFDAHNKGAKPGTLLASTNSATAHESLPASATLRYLPGGVSDARFNEITRWSSSRQFDSGQYASADSDFKAIKQKLRTDKADPAVHELSDLQVFEFGDFLRGDDAADLGSRRMEEIASRQERYWAHTHWPDVAPGRSFNLEGDPNGAADDQYLIASCTFVVSHSGYESLKFHEEQIHLSQLLAPAIAGDAVNPPGSQNHQEWLAHLHSDKALTTGQPSSRAFLITALPASQAWRVPRLSTQTKMPGPQTGLVVGPAGEEIHADDFGRVKVHFHWDRYDASNEKSTAWIRVSHPWGGKTWGHQATPRIGQEVIVDFLNGDPDRPIIMGRVYNDDQPIPFKSHTISGTRTRSTPGGTPENFNELSFDDKMGAERVFLHAEKNQDIEVENDETHWVGHDRTKTIDNDETNHIKRDRTETVDRNEKITVHGWRTEEVDLDESITIHKNRKERVDNNETISIGDNRSEDVGKNETISIGNNRTETVGDNETVNIGKNRSVTIGGAKSETIAKTKTETIALAKALSIGLGYQTSVGAAMNTSVGGFQGTQVGLYKNTMVGGNYTIKVGASYGLDVSKDIVIDAGASITLRVGKSILVMKKDGTVTLNGKDIDVVGSKHIGMESKRIDLN